MKLPKFLYSFKKQLASDKLQEYFASGRRPFSEGYSQYRFNLIGKTLANEAMMERFRRHEMLPEGYGKYVDERVVEYPWLLSRLGSGKTLLDAGSTLNNLTVLEHRNLAPYKKYIVTLAPESACYWQQGISYVYDDLRDLPFKDGYFDVITCISTLEHVGMDNTMHYTSDPVFKEKKSDDYLKVVHELRRVLKPGGKCYITTPFGQYQYDVFQQQFNADMLGGLIEAFQPTKCTEHYFKYSASGWNIAKKEDCLEAVYFNVHRTKYFEPASTLDFDEDKAAAARAVAALELIKE